MLSRDKTNRGLRPTDLGGGVRPVHGLQSQAREIDMRIARDVTPCSYD